MGVLRISAAILAGVLLAAVPRTGIEASDTGSCVLDWRKGVLEVAGRADITEGVSGNTVDRQQEANTIAMRRVAEAFVRAMALVRVDAYNTAQQVLLGEPDRNERLYRYISGFGKRRVSYTDTGVTITASFPLYGREGFANVLVSAGLDPEFFPEYDEYVFSASFTGLVVDARGLGRVPAVAPRILDEEHRVVYSKDFVDPASFERNGAVQYTSDPYYRGLEERVGDKPFRVVAIADDKTIETDVTIHSFEAKTLLQKADSRKNLAKGRVVIIIDDDVMVQRKGFRF